MPGVAHTTTLPHDYLAKRVQGHRAAHVEERRMRRLWARGSAVKATIPSAQNERSYRQILQSCSDAIGLRFATDLLDLVP